MGLSDTTQDNQNLIFIGKNSKMIENGITLELDGTDTLSANSPMRIDKKSDLPMFLPITGKHGFSFYATDTLRRSGEATRLSRCTRF